MVAFHINYGYGPTSRADNQSDFTPVSYGVGILWRHAVIPQSRRLGIGDAERGARIVKPTRGRYGVVCRGNPVWSIPERLELKFHERRYTSTLYLYLYLLLRVEANSATYPQWDRKWVVTFFVWAEGLCSVLATNIIIFIISIYYYYCYLFFYSVMFYFLLK